MSPLFYRLVFTGSTGSSFRAAFPDLEQRSGPNQASRAASNIDWESVSTRDMALPVMASDGLHTVLEGPVLDAAQLAGIVSEICHRNGKIIRVELMTSEWEA